MKKIIDEFTNLKVSRQRRWQLRHVKKGLCAKCGKPSISGGLCIYHRIKEAKKDRRRHKSIRCHKSKWLHLHNIQ
jgi:hypothetical protein